MTSSYAAKSRFYISRARAARLRGEHALSRGFLDTAALWRLAHAATVRAAR